MRRPPPAVRTVPLRWGREGGGGGADADAHFPEAVRQNGAVIRIGNEKQRPHISSTLLVSFRYIVVVSDILSGEKQYDWYNHEMHRMMAIIDCAFSAPYAPANSAAVVAATTAFTW
jgi:hypothetical protein